MFAGISLPALPASAADVAGLPDFVRCRVGVDKTHGGRFKLHVRRAASASVSIVRLLTAVRTSANASGRCTLRSRR